MVERLLGPRMDRRVRPDRAGGQRERFNGEVGPSGMREEADGAALVAQSYNMFRFYMAAQGRGRLPVKFNGGLFTQQIG